MTARNPSEGRNAHPRRPQDEHTVRLPDAPERPAPVETDPLAERVRRLQAITDAALTHLSLDELFAELLGRLRQLLRTDSATVLLRNPETNLLHVHASHGLARDADDMVDVPFGKGVAGRIAAEARPTVIEDLRRETSVSA
jgi:transcriptional regulator with GAF, ATPase, and Fis domain